MRVCSCVWLTTHAGCARRSALSEGRVDLPAGQQHVFCVTFLFMTKLLFSCCYPFFFFWKENGLWKAIQQQEQQQQQQRELLWKILSSEKKIWNVHYSWQIFALTFCFLSVNFCLTRFLFFMFYSHSACSWQLGWHAPPPVYPLPLMTFPVLCQPASQPDCMFD